MELAGDAHPYEHMVAQCGGVAVTDVRLVARGGRGRNAGYREIALGAVAAVGLRRRPRTTTIVLGIAVVLLGFLAGAGSPLQVFAAVMGVLGVVVGIGYGDQLLEVTARAQDARPVRWPLRDVGGDEAAEFVRVVRAALAGDLPATDAAPRRAPRPGDPRSVLVTAADDAPGIMAALASDADAVCLDLPDLVHPSRRDAARALVPSAAALAHQGGRTLWLRVDPDTWEEDLEAWVAPGLTAVVVPADAPARVREVDAALRYWERAQGMGAGVGIVLSVRSAADVFALADALAASGRVCAIVDASDALSLADGAAWPGDGGMARLLRAGMPPERAHVRGRVFAATAETETPVYARMAGAVAPGWIAAALGDGYAERLAEAAASARAYGYRGAVTAHPEAVAACNHAFPIASPQAVAAAPSVGAPQPSPWQPVVPSHYGIGAPPAQPEPPGPEPHSDAVREEPSR